MTTYAPDLLRDRRHDGARAAREVADWLAHLEVEDKAPRTLDDYERTVAALLREYPEHKLVDFTRTELTNFLHARSEGRRRVSYAHLNSFFKWGRLVGTLPENTMDRVPRPKRRGQRYIEVFTETEIASLIALPMPDGQLFTLLFDVGLRKAEARGLQRRHISLERAELVIHKAKGRKERVVPLTMRVQSAIADLDIVEALDPEDHLWYSKPGGGGIVQRRFLTDDGPGNGTWHRWYVRCLKRADVIYIPRSKTQEGIHNPHVTRHTFATRFLRAGGRIERLSLLMGHKSIQTTWDEYGHLTVDDARSDLALLEV
jgi:integrase